MGTKPIIEVSAWDKMLMEHLVEMMQTQLFIMKEITKARMVPKIMSQISFGEEALKSDDTPSN